MTISPDYSRKVAQRVRAYYQEAEDYVLARVVRSLAKGLDASDWEARKQGDLSKVLRTIDTHLERIDEAAPELISRAVAEAYQAGEGAAASDMRAAGLEAIGGEASSRAVDVLAEDTIKAMDGARPRILRASRDVYQRVTADTAAQVLTGAKTRREAARDAVRTYALDGIKPFVDESGRRWETGAYAEMATRTTAGKAAIAGHTDRLQAMGQDLVIVSTSPESCELCSPWEGEVLSISGDDESGEAVASIDEARDAGLQHPNCTHTVGLYLSGRTKPHTQKSDPEAYRARQQQRAYERSVRRWKRAVEIDEQTLGKDAPQAVKTRQRLRDRQAEFKAFREEHGRKNLTYRTNLTAR